MSAHANHDRLVRVAVSAALILLLHGCDMVQPQAAVRLSLPPVPAWVAAAYADSAFFRIEWIGADGVRKRREQPVNRRDSVILLPKLYNSAVLVYLVTPSNGSSAAYSLLPGGALFPYHLRADGKLVLSWEAGAAALIMQRITVQTGRPHRYNAPRLHEELLARTDNDPWSVDTESVAEQLLAGAFRVTAIRPAERFAVFIPLPAGRWHSENLLQPALETDEWPTASGEPAAGLHLLLKRGVHRFFHSDGIHVLSVVIEDNGIARWLICARLPDHDVHQLVGNGYDLDQLLSVCELRDPL